jgi:hypothetical protein
MSLPLAVRDFYTWKRNSLIEAAEERRLLTQSFSNQRREAEAAVVGELRVRQAWESQVSALHEELGHAGRTEQLLREHLGAAQTTRFSEEQVVAELGDHRSSLLRAQVRVPP